MTTTIKNYELKIKNFGAYGFGLAVAAGVLFGGPAFAQAATLSLSPTSGTYAAGSTFEVKVLLDTAGKKTSGTDAYIRYDPNSLQVVDANTSTEGVQILPGTLYSQTSYNLTDNAAGKISFSGSKTGGSPGYSGSGTLATITFSAVKATASTDVTFDFTSGSTTDSNVIDETTSEDALTSVTDAKYVLGAAGTGTTSTGTSTTTGTGSGTTTGTGSGTTGASGNSGAEGTGGTTTVAGTGLDLNGYILLTVVSLIGAGYFLRPRAKTKSR